MLTIDKVYKAKQVLKNVIRKTDLIYANKILCDNDIYLKPENLQITGSFKVRGSYFKISQLTETEKRQGIIACSAGNHSQGVALASTKNNVNSTIYIPSTAPKSKVEATKKFGAKVVLVDGTYDDAYLEAKKYADETDMKFIHPFNDEDIIAGQGTIALELLDDLPTLDAVVVPIGGGGLVSGIAFTIKTINPACKVYGVQSSCAPSMYNSLNHNKIETLKTVSTIADGIAVKCPGDLTYTFCKDYLDGIVTVSEEEIMVAILTLLEGQKLIAEGAGAASVAAVMFNKIPLENKKVACIVSGGNIDINVLTRIIQESLVAK